MKYFIVFLIFLFPLLVSADDCSCIVYAREQGVAIPYGTNAWDLKGNSTPIVGGLALLSYKVDHVAVITKLEETGFWISEANYVKCEVTTRFIKWSDSHLTGFWSPKLLTK